MKDFVFKLLMPYYVIIKFFADKHLKLYRTGRFVLIGDNNHGTSGTSNKNSRIELL